MYRLLLVVGWSMPWFPSWAQTVSHIQQVPIHFNPAFAGERGKARLALYTSREETRYTYGTSRILYTTVASFDDRRQKLCYGLEVMGTRAKSYTTNHYLGFKGCVGRLFEGERKGGAKKYTLTTAAGFTYRSTNNHFLSTQVNFQNGYSYRFPSRTWEKSIEQWPNESRQVHIGILYKSEHTKLALGLGYSRQLMNQRNAVKNVPYNYNPQNTTLEERMRVDEAIDNTPTVYVDSVTRYRWNEYTASLYASQSFSFDKKKEFGLLLFVNNLLYHRTEIPDFLPVGMKTEAVFVGGILARYRGWFAGYQPSLWLYYYNSQYNHYGYQYPAVDPFIGGVEGKRYSLVGSFTYWKNDFSRRMSVSLSANYLF